MTRRAATAAALLALGLWTSTARAQQDGQPSDAFQAPQPNRYDGWEAGLQLLWINVAGYNERHGDIVRDSSTVGLGSNMTDSQPREAIQTNLGDRITLRAELEYRQGWWGAGVSGWWVNTSDDIHGHVESPPPSGNTTSTSFVLMFEDGRGPTTNQLQPSGLSPDDYFANDKLRSFTTDLYGLYTIAEGQRSRLELTFGAKLGQLDTRQSRGLAEHSFIAQTTDLNGMMVTLNPPFDNQISLTSTASSDFFGAGPMLGLRGGAQWERFGLRWFFTQSLMLGNSRFKGLFTDIDNIGSSPVLPDLGFQGPGVIRSDISYANSKTVCVPITEAQLKLTYNLSSYVTIGIGGFMSVWWNVPVAPTWAMPTVGAQSGQGQTSISFVGNWTEQARTLSFLGGFVELGFRY
jgi:hypothetical protein